jgi:hypothetical protein
MTSKPLDTETLIINSGLFDAEWYLATYPDVLESGLEPFAHFMTIGARLKRDPGPSFSARRYLETNTDVAELGLDPLLHYLRSKERGERPRQVFPSSARLPDSSQIYDYKMRERIETLEIENELLILQLHKVQAQLESTGK